MLQVRVCGLRVVVAISEEFVLEKQEAFLVYIHHVHGADLQELMSVPVLITGNRVLTVGVREVNRLQIYFGYVRLLYAYWFVSV